MSTCGGTLNFPNGTLRTTYNGAKVGLWANATCSTSVDWCGLGMSAATIYYNTGTL